MGHCLIEWCLHVHRQSMIHRQYSNCQSNSLSVCFLTSQSVLNCLFFWFKNSVSPFFDLIKNKLMARFAVKIFFLQNFNLKKSMFVSIVTPRLPISVQRKCQPIRSSRLAGYRKTYILMSCKKICRSNICS